MLNIPGLITKKFNKLQSDYLRRVFKENDVVCFTEVWGDPSQVFDYDGFTFYELHRVEKKATTTRNSGGVIIYVRNSFVSSDTLFLKCSESHVWLKLNKTMLGFENDVYLCLCYIPPSNSSRQGLIDTCVYDEILQNIVHIKHITADNCNFIILGDMNSRIGQHCDYVTEDYATHMDVLPDDYVPDLKIPRKSQDNTVQLLLDFLKQSGLRIANGRVREDRDVGAYTFVGSRGSSLVDYCIANVDLFELFVSFYVHDPNPLSDHCLIEFSLSSNIDLETPVECDNDGSNFQYFKWSSEHREEYKARISSGIFKEEITSLMHVVDDASCENDINSSISSFSALLDTVCTPLFGKTSHSTLTKDRDQKKIDFEFDHLCADKRKQFYHSLNIFRKNKSSENRQQMIMARTEYKNSVRNFNYNKQQQKSIKLLNARYKNAKEYWKLLKESVTRQTSKHPSANDFDEYFKAINNPDSHFFQPDDDILYFNERFLNSEIQIMFDELNCTITVQEINKAIKNLKNGRSGGPDRFLNEFFIHGNTEMVSYLHVLFNKIFDLEYFPESWSEGFIVPLHKKGSQDDGNNYRGITLLSTLGKLFTSILNNRLKTWAEEYHVYVEAQAGFRASMGTTDNIFVMHGVINHLLNKGEKLFCAFVDFTKAFDYVVREVIWYKLIKIGERGKILNIIMSM